MGGGGSDNSAMINLQKEQAAQARQKEAERSARLQSGSDFITSLFDGTPSGAKTLDLSSLLDPNAGSAFSSNKAHGKTYTRGQLGLADGYYVGQTPDNGSGANRRSQREETTSR